MFSFLTKIGPKSGLGEHYGQNLSDKKGLIRTIGKEMTNLKVCILLSSCQCVKMIPNFKILLPYP